MSQLKSYQKSQMRSDINVNQLHAEIRFSGFVDGFEGLLADDLTLIILGDEIVDEFALDSLVLNHETNYQLLFIEGSVVQNKAFADDLIQRFKKKNLSEGLSSIDQAAWVHHRLRKMDYTLSDNQTVIQLDVLNLVVSGDIETAFFCLGQLEPDSMNEEYHFLSQERIDWLRSEIAQYLGWA